MRKFYFLALLAIPLLCLGAGNEEAPSSADDEVTEQSGGVETSIAAVYGDGKYLVMQDDSKWEVRKQDQNKTGGWLGPADVRISPSGKSDYPYKIFNKWTHSVVYAKRVEDVSDTENPKSIP